jgi:hypothetical protein
VTQIFGAVFCDRVVLKYILLHVVHVIIVVVVREQGRRGMNGTKGSLLSAGMQVVSYVPFVIPRGPLELTSVGEVH